MSDLVNLKLRRPTLKRVDQLSSSGFVAADEVSVLEEVAEHFSIAITPDMADLITPGDASDPIAGQFVPTAAELTIRPEERADPIGDDPFTPIKGVTHRYPDRVLLKPVHVCPIYCRFCFRREKVGPGSEVLTREEFANAIEYIRSRPAIWEVILTGGDPLILSPQKLSEITRALATIPHVKVIRVHTRVPVVDPGRVTPELVEALKVGTVAYVVLHTNHARELTPAARAACAAFVDRGIPMLSQSVLLRGVNNDPKVLEELFRELIEARVKPYYLHQGDLAKGTSHFRTSVAEGQELMRTLRGRVSGICQPTYVLDIPGGHGKVPIGPAYFQHATDGGATEAPAVVMDYQGNPHTYPPVSDSASLQEE
jgi:lysine 2,3-aminomutase